MQEQLHGSQGYIGSGELQILMIPLIVAAGQSSAVYLTHLMGRLSTGQ